MVLKGYFDGGNQTDSTQYKHVTLAGLLGTVQMWDRYEKNWADLLRRHAPTKYLHTTDANSQQRDFKNWDRSAIEALLRDSGETLKRELTTTCDGEVNGLIPITTTVKLADFMRAHRERNDLGTPEQLCIDGCIGAVDKVASLLGACSLQLIFDRGESFYGYLENRRTNQRSRRHDSQFWKVYDHGSSGQANSRCVPALQGCDLLAWSTNKAHDKKASDWQLDLLSSCGISTYADYDLISKPNEKALKIVASFGLLRRKPPK